MIRTESSGVPSESFVRLCLSANPVHPPRVGDITRTLFMDPITPSRCLTHTYIFCRPHHLQPERLLSLQGESCRSATDPSAITVPIFSYCFMCCFSFKRQIKHETLLCCCAAFIKEPQEITEDPRRDQQILSTISQGHNISVRLLSRQCHNNSVSLLEFATPGLKLCVSIVQDLLELAKSRSTLITLCLPVVSVEQCSIHSFVASLPSFLRNLSLSLTLAFVSFYTHPQSPARIQDEALFEMQVLTTHAHYSDGFLPYTTFDSYCLLRKNTLQYS